jgi:hypothetical protein
MDGLGFLDLVIGLVFIYFLLSLVVSIVQEIRANTFKIRSKNLEDWFLDTLDCNQLGANLLEHKLIAGLVKKGRKPSYVPNENFVSALLDTINVNHNGGKPYDINSIKEAIDNTNLLPDDLKRHIQQSISEASGELGSVKKDISDWFDGCMARVGGTYKNIQQKWLIIISFIVVVAFNADSISLITYLYENEDARTALATQAAAASQDSTLMAIKEKYIELDSLQAAGAAVDTVYSDAIKNIQTGIEDLKAISTTLGNLKLHLGWSTDENSLTTYPTSWGGLFLKIIGLAISAFAVSLGTPFWFETLNKLVSIRGAGKKPGSKT